MVPCSDSRCVDGSSGDSKLRDALKYLRQVIACGGSVENIQNWAAHYLYGTRPEVLANLSNAGIVYNPPGH